MEVKNNGSQIAIYFHSVLMLAEIKRTAWWDSGLFTTDIINKIQFNLILDIVLTSPLFSHMKSKKTLD